ncbi:MAG: RNA-binding transcriptional accessory protein, partial [Hyphomicrobiales bacterium]|nr:RNA-binding transcriptional accessory protein [Hyphomicrobiales bacterium]
AILVERFAEDAELIGRLREDFWTRGVLQSKVREGKQQDGAKFSDYFDFSEPLPKIPSHRILAVMRGEREEILDVKLVADPAADPAVRAPGPYELAISAKCGVADRGRPGDKWLVETVRWAWRTKIEMQLAIDLRMRLWTHAEEEAVRIFGSNLRDLLLAAPAGARATMGLDPGFRTGVKVAVVDATGKVVATTAIFPHEPQRRWEDSLVALAALCQKHNVELIAIGNGTASRETDKLAGELLKKFPQIKATRVVVSEAGASVYSASAYAAQELPELDVTLRGAVSIARRLQDPLAELVKVEPKAIGVGQYQHDVSEHKLNRSLDAVVEDCVNAVGVDVNTASAKLLARVSGVGESLAQSIVSYRDANGPYRTRADLKKAPRLGARAFELSAGFLRIVGGDDPLDRSGVHPESYPVVRKIVAKAGADIGALIGNGKALSALRPADFVDETFGLPTVKDILKELEKPGRDPRPAFKTAEFMEGVETIGDLRPGMILEGAVTNVAAFGAFVDIGVHQDGLVHVSAMSRNFVKDPREIAKPGDIVKVKVLEVDAPRKRISLTMRLDDEAAPRKPQGQRMERGQERFARQPERPSAGGALADALKRAAERRR